MQVPQELQTEFEALRDAFAHYSEILLSGNDESTYQAYRSLKRCRSNLLSQVDEKIVNRISKTMNNIVLTGARKKMSSEDTPNRLLLDGETSVEAAKLELELFKIVSQKRGGRLYLSTWPVRRRTVDMNSTYGQLGDLCEAAKDSNVVVKILRCHYVGFEVVKPCSHCKAGDGYFRSCVVVRITDGKRIREQLLPEGCTSCRMLKTPCDVSVEVEETYLEDDIDSGGDTALASLKGGTGLVNDIYVEDSVVTEDEEDAGTMDGKVIKDDAATKNSTDMEYYPSIDDHTDSETEPDVEMNDIEMDMDDGR